MNVSYIALGSNLNQPQQQVSNAVIEIAQLGNITAQSSWYRSKAIGPGEQDDYINGVLCLDTSLNAIALLNALHAIENHHNRVRNIRWGARTLDLDILLFNHDIINTTINHSLDDDLNDGLNDAINKATNHNSLIIPHPRMTERNFVIYPLCEIAPKLILPDNQSIINIKNTLSTQGLEKLS